jgi:hypothetical protein
MEPGTESILAAFEAVLITARRGINQTVQGGLPCDGVLGKCVPWIVSTHLNRGRPTGKIVIICSDLLVSREVQDQLRLRGHRPNAPKSMSTSASSLAYTMPDQIHETIIVTPAAA